MGGVIALTGAGGYIGQRLIEHLDRWEGCSAILGTDIRGPDVRSEKLTFLKKDIRDGTLADFWKGREVDALVHLAFVVDPIRDENAMYDINVNGTLNVLKICEDLKVPHVIAASSGTAYGAWPDNPLRLREDDPIRVYPPTMNYAHHKGLNEKHFDDFRRRNPDVLFNTVRPSVVYGPNVDNYLSRFLKRLPFVPLSDGCDPEMQLVHEEDVARLFTLLIEKKVDGPFNVAGSGVLRVSELGAMVGKKALPVPRRLLFPIVHLLWKMHLIMEAPAGLVDYMAYPWVLDIGRARDLLGFEPEYSTKRTARIMFETHGYQIRKPV
jgi:UDP-glucose 4-epimerase